jgi:hypothetical protein
MDSPRGIGQQKGIDLPLCPVFFVVCPPAILTIVKKR